MGKKVSLKEIKTQYDQKLRDLEKRPDAFREGNYSAYFKNDVFSSEIVCKMSKKDYEAYGAGAGGELLDKEGKKGIVPAKMSSVGSSSRFCYLSLKGTDFSVFGIKDKSFHRRFEEKLIVVSGTPPHIDCYYEDGDEIVCFECKCHEQFDHHKIELAESYFSNDRIVTKIGKEYLTKKQKTNKKSGNKSYYYEINPRIVGLSNNPRFDIKQFFTHIMGMQSRLTKQKKRKARLIYYYFIPDEVLSNNSIKAVIETLFDEIKTVFNSPFIKENVKNITFELYVQFSKTVETANKSNTKRMITE